MVRAAANGLGYLSLLADLGVQLRLRVWTDSTASQGMCGRQGLGKVRHLDVQELWVQQRMRKRDFDLFKVKCEENPGDLFTKAGLTESRITNLLELLNCEYRGGRASSAPALRQEGGTKSFVLSKGEHQSGGFKQRKRRAQQERHASTTPTPTLVRAVLRPTTVTSKLSGAPLQGAPPSGVSNQAQSGGGKRWADGGGRRVL